jgi:glycosyltransferase involved in cell wall biosynthesis
MGNGYIKNRLTKNTKLLEELERFNPDIVYFRYDTWSMTLNTILKKYKVVTEINTNDVGEFLYLFKKEKSPKSFLRYLAYKFLRGVVFSQVEGIVTITRELATAKHFSKFKKPTIYVSNSIDTDIFKTIKKSDHKKIELFFIGTPNQPWHGVDILEELAIKLPDFNFHVVGIDGISSDNIIYHGYLQQKEYLEILGRCSVCIGSLAMYRNNMFESNSLKVREYIALGFPVLLGCQDVAFLDVEKPAWLKIIDTQKVLDINEIESFILNMSEHVLKESDKLLVSSSYNEKIRYQFFEKVNNS